MHYEFQLISARAVDSSSRFVWVLWVCALLGNSQARRNKFLNGPHCKFSQLYVYE